MNKYFSFTKSVEDILLTCKGEYWATRTCSPENIELTDVLHLGGSIINLMSPQFIERIEDYANERAYDDWVCTREDHVDARRTT